MPANFGRRFRMIAGDARECGEQPAPCIGVPLILDYTRTRCLEIASDRGKQQRVQLLTIYETGSRIYSLDGLLLGGGTAAY
jgi:hypothetical protein